MLLIKITLYLFLYCNNDILKYFFNEKFLVTL